MDTSLLGDNVVYSMTYFSVLFLILTSSQVIIKEILSVANYLNPRK